KQSSRRSPPTRRSPSSWRLRRRTREWRRARARACCLKRPFSASVPQRKTRRKVPPPSSKSAHPSSMGGEANSLRTTNRERPHGRRNHLLGTESCGFCELHRGSQYRGDLVRLWRRRRQSGAACRRLLENGSKNPAAAAGKRCLSLALGQSQ